MAPSPTAPALHERIPLAYRLLHLYIEPLMALNGAVMCLFQPSVFLHTFSARLQYVASSQVIYEQLAATYFFFAFVEAVVLRATSELRVWKAVVAGILACDVLHLMAGVRVLAADGKMGVWATWRWQDWLAVGSLVGPGCLRAAFLMGVGLRGVRAKGSKVDGDKKG